MKTNDNNINYIKNNEDFFMSFQEISIILEISENEVKRIYSSAIRKLKHPKYFKYFREIIKNNDITSETLEKYGDTLIKD